MLKRRVSIITLLLGLLVVTARAQSTDHKPVVGVATFANPYSYNNPTIGPGFRDLLAAELKKSGRYDLIERAALDDLADEIAFGGPDYGHRKACLPKGDLQGLEYLIVGNVTSIGVRDTSYGLIVGVRSKEAYVQIDFRILDATTGETVYHGSGEATDNSKGFGLATGPAYNAVGTVDQSNRFQKSQVGRATIKAIQQAVAGIDRADLTNRISGAQDLAAKTEAAERSIEESRARTPGRILAVGGDRDIIVSLGTFNGLKEGDTLQVFRLDIVRDSAGRPVFTQERPVGVITLTDVQRDRSKAMRVSGERFEEGFVVRRM